jgi:hypothetical protein
MIFCSDYIATAWYCTKGRHEEGKKALHRLIGNVDGYNVDHEYSVLAYETKRSRELAEAAGSSGWRALLTKTNIKRSVVATLPFTFQNVCGVPLMFGYTVYFFQLAGVKDPFLGNLIKQLVLVLGILTSFYTVDVVGRRALIIYGGGAMCIINILVGALGFMKPTPAGGIALVFLCSLWAFVYANSLAPIGKSYISGYIHGALRILTTDRLDQSRRDIVAPSPRQDDFGCRYHPILHWHPFRKSMSDSYNDGTPN